MGFLNSPKWIDVENWPISWEIGGTSWFPFLESIHVIAAAFVVGSILMVDLRLLGIAAVKYSISTLSKELVPWTWGRVRDCNDYRPWHVHHARRLTCSKSSFSVEDGLARPRRRKHDVFPLPRL